MTAIDSLTGIPLDMLNPPRRNAFWIPGPLPGLNELIAAAKGQGGTGRAYAALKKRWTREIAMRIKIAKVMPVAPARMVFLWVEKNKRRDPDNVAAGGRKLILDALVVAKVLKNDGWAEVQSWSDTFATGDPPGVNVEVIET